MRLKAYHLLVASNRHTGGGDYEQLCDSFRRLAGIRIETNIVTNGQRIRQGFGLLDNWKTLEKTSTGRLILVELTLNEWLFNAAIGREVLTLNPDYFRISGGLGRRHELARKHCGSQERWAIGLELLHKKGSFTAPLWKFVINIGDVRGINI